MTRGEYERARKALEAALALWAGLAINEEAIGTTFVFDLPALMLAGVVGYSPQPRSNGRPISRD
jgi:hypothetical protein